MGATVELRLPGPLTEDDVASSCASLRASLRSGGVSRVVCHLDGVCSDLLVVEALARLALTARRGGVVAFDLRGQDVGLASLLRLVGLSGLLLASGEP